MGLRKGFASLAPKVASFLRIYRPELTPPEPVTLEVRGQLVPAALYDYPISDTESIRICLADRRGIDPIADSIADGMAQPVGLFDLLPETVPQGGRVVDLGTHVGTFTLFSAWKGYEVLAIDASPLNCALLRESVRANGFTNVTIIESAASDHETTLRFFENGPFGFVVDEKDTQRTTVQVEAKRVSTILNEIGWDHVDFVKMDIEGSEPAAIAGMQELLQRPNAPAMLVESNGHTLNQFGHSPTSLKKQLNALGYQLYLTQQSKLRPCSVDEPQGNVLVDYLATKSTPQCESWKVTGPLTKSEHLAAILQSLCSANRLEKRWGQNLLNLFTELCIQHPKILEMYPGLPLKIEQKAA
ncbi:FkbM family methyltransferase [Blastopirellula sp. JC732]|uniref:FkbM family methyltransferase n=1 Tax=Blastopirellula sediminis TaxID=2894196 RepID=A0A9X1MSE6_9BACT|nr:FkbM family methyltransferase [Blastopirellula sediminis]MCC9604780.1 FkbM family methyltransferase [Blastopirellula sediminis]MCC9631921.1 FkbM family methyltransferase [Blastopirellula sediminis]